MRMWVQSLASLSGLRIRGCSVGCRRSLDPALLCLWCRLAAIAPIRPLAWERVWAQKASKQTKSHLGYGKKLHKWDVHYHVTYCWGVLLAGLIIKLKQINEQEKKTQFNLYAQRSYRTRTPEVIKAGCLYIIFRSKNNYLWRFNKGACAWDRRLKKKQSLSIEFS